MTQKDNGETYSFDVCSQCKSICCQDAKPPLTKNRKEKIQKYLADQKISLKNPFTQEAYSYPSVDEQIYCRLFSKQTGKCMVHPVKPETCIAGPITFDINFKTKKLEYYLKMEEICAYAGVLYRDKQAFEALLGAARVELMRLVSELSADELRAIVQIEEPKTFKVAEDPLPDMVVKKLGL
jgi:Fe-S-cluster containining protein